MRRLLTVCLAVCMLLGVLPAQADTVGQAWRTAALYVPASAMPESLAESEEGLTFLFVDALKGRSYEVLVNREPVALMRLTVAVNDVKGASAMTYQPELIGDQVAHEYPGTSLQGVFSGGTQDGYYYVAVFDDAPRGRHFRAWFNAGSGLMMRSVMTVAPPQAEGQALLAPDEAARIALDAVPGSALYDVRWQQVGPGFLYLIGVIAGGEEITVTVHAGSGAVLGQVAQATGLTPAQGKTTAAARTAPPKTAPPKPAATAAPKPAATAAPPAPTTAPVQAAAATAPPAPVVTQVPVWDDDEWDDDEWDDDAWDDDELDDDELDDDELDDDELDDDELDDDELDDELDD